MTPLQSTLALIKPVDPVWIERARHRLDRLTKPPGSLGRLEWIAARLCAIQETLAPLAGPRRIAIFAADHGVASEGVSAYPSIVTAQMVANFLRGGAAINTLAAAAGADVCVVDVGVAHPVDAGGTCAAFAARRIGDGTHNMTRRAAMDAAEAEAALQAGIDVAEAAASAGVKLFACGDMGIGNTTAASAITAAMTRSPAATVTGSGTGVDAPTLARKVAAVTEALRVNRPGRDPLLVLRSVGGFEIAAIAGAYLGAARHRMTIVGDGFVTTAAALIAAELCPAFLDYWFAGHRSPEPGHAIQLDYLRQTPLVDLGLRLGEATGAALAMPIVGAAAAMMTGMATFEEAGVAAPV
jgi:nicotinate-nucleotide--dimethylbenzimidazole phosphoribosyltransferase